MSGITDIFHTDGKPAAREHLALMATGPSFIQSDGIDVWHDDPVGMGQLEPYGSSASANSKS